MQAVYLVQNLIRFLVFLPPLLGILHLALWKSGVLGLNSIKDDGYRYAELFMGSTAVGAQALSAESSKQNYRTKTTWVNRLRAFAAERLNAAGFFATAKYVRVPPELSDMSPETGVDPVEQTAPAVRQLSVARRDEAWLQMALSLNSYATALTYMHACFGYSPRQDSGDNVASRNIKNGMPKRF